MKKIEHSHAGHFNHRQRIVEHDKLWSGRIIRKGSLKVGPRLLNLIARKGIAHAIAFRIRDLDDHRFVGVQILQNDVEITIALPCLKLLLETHELCLDGEGLLLEIIQAHIVGRCIGRWRRN